MADTKITALTAITTVDPAADVLPIVDVSDTSMAASGTTKKITSNQILGAGGTATLASATITGDLTVDTSTLKVDSTNNRVGIGTASPAVTLDISDPSAVIRATSSTGTNTSFAAFANTGGAVRVGAENSAGGGLFTGSSAYSAVLGTTGAYSAHIGTNATVRYSIASDGVATWSNVGGSSGTAMTLNSTGLGVGTSPSYQLHVSKSQSSATTLFVDNQQNNAAASSDLSLSAYGGNWNLSVPHSATFVNPLIFKFGSTERMRITSDGNVGIGVASPAFKLDVAGSAGSGIRFTGNSVQNVIGETGGNGLVGTVSNHNLGFYTNATLRALIDTSGQVGIGVQPSAWAAGYKVIQGQIGGFALSNDNSSNNQFRLSSNAYFDTTDNRWEYYGTSTATAYEQRAGEHRFFNAPSGTLNTAITFTQAMTLDASGNLLVGTTGLNGSWNTKLTLSNDSGTTKWAVGPYLGGVTNFLISAGASAGVYLNGTAATSWTSASDERLKDIIEPISNAISKVASLRAVIGKFKFDENNTRKPFLIAQDIQAVLPEAVDASNPEKLGVAYTDVIPLLVAAIKELTARVQTLETR